MSRPSLLERVALNHAERANAQLLRRLRTIEHSNAVRVTLDGKELISFCSNDYLGLANHPDVIATLKSVADKQGVGSTAAHLICGHRREHVQLEEEIADWVQRPRALLFSTGYMANLGVLSALLQPGDLCVQDKLNHASLLDGARLAGAELKRYRHNDVDAAARQLATRPETPALLATDGVFSMDGDVAPLIELANLCQSTKVTFMVDDAHGLGVFGDEGKGSAHAAGLSTDDVPILMGTLGKAVGTFGAFVVGSEAFIEALIQFSRTFIYTTAMPPALASATRTSIRIVRKENWRREKLNKLIQRFRQDAQQIGLPLLKSMSPIQPLVLGTAQAAISAASQLEQYGFLVTAIRPPTVPDGSARLRITLSAAHEEEDVDRLLEALAKVIANDDHAH